MNLPWYCTKQQHTTTCLCLFCDTETFTDSRELMYENIGLSLVLRQRAESLALDLTAHRLSPALSSSHLHSSGMRDWLSQLTPGLHCAFGITARRKPWSTWARTWRSLQHGTVHRSWSVQKGRHTTRTELSDGLWDAVSLILIHDRLWQAPVRHWPGQVLVWWEAPVLLPEQMQWIRVLSLYSGTVWFVHFVSFKERERKKICLLLYSITECDDEEEEIQFLWAEKDISKWSGTKWKSLLIMW